MMPHCLVGESVRMVALLPVPVDSLIGAFLLNCMRTRLEGKYSVSLHQEIYPRFTFTWKCISWGPPHCVTLLYPLTPSTFIFNKTPSNLSGSVAQHSEWLLKTSIQTTLELHTWLIWNALQMQKLIQIVLHRFNSQLISIKFGINMLLGKDCDNWIT